MGLPEAEKVELPERTRERFRGRRFVQAEPQLLDHEGAELILIGADEDVPGELGIDLHPEACVSALASRAGVPLVAAGLIAASGGDTGGGRDGAQRQSDERAHEELRRGPRGADVEPGGGAGRAGPRVAEEQPEERREEARDDDGSERDRSACEQD